MPAPFLEVQFPARISVEAEGGPGYATSVVVGAGGREARNSQWAAERHAWTVGHVPKLPAEWEPLRAFFRLVRGKGSGFRFKDWTDYQATLAVNYGIEAFKDDKRRLLLEAGPGLRRARLADSGLREQDALLRGFADYQHQVTDTTSFFNTLLVEAAQDNTFVQNDIGVAVSINRSLALKAALQARHNSDAPADRERTDTLASVNIVWSPRSKAD